MRTYNFQSILKWCDGIFKGQSHEMDQAFVSMIHNSRRAGAAF